TVYASPELPQTRYLTLNRQRFVPGDRQRVLLPLAFCRECGQDYYVVRREPTEDGTSLVPRDLGDTHDDDSHQSGFLYLSDDRPWPDDEDEVNDRLPEDWFDARGRLKSDRRDRLPRTVWVRPDGTLDPEGSDPTSA